MKKLTNNVLFCSQSLEGRNCGIGFIGELIGEALSFSTKYNIITLFCDDVATFLTAMDEYNPTAVIINYCSPAFQWVNIEAFKNKWPDTAYLLLHHDVNLDVITHNNTFGFDGIVFHDPTLPETDRMFPLRRLIPEYEIDTYVEPDRPMIGFQGFGAGHKGIARLAHTVVHEFDEAIINLQIPAAFFGSSLACAHKRVQEVRSIISKKTGIELRASHDLLTPQELVKFMSKNTINCYFYDYSHNAGLASAPDYALAARRPIALTNSFQFRNFLDIPEVFIENHSLKEIISLGTSHLEPLYEAGSQANIIADYERVIDKVTNQKQCLKK